RGDVSSLDQLDPLPARMPRRTRVEHAAAAESRLAAQYHVVATRGHGRCGQAQLRVTLADPADDGRDLGSSVVDVQPGTVLDRSKLFEREVEAVTGRIGARGDQGLAAMEARALDPWEAGRDAL